MKKYLKLIPALCLSFCDVANAAIDTGEVLYAERPGALWNTSESPVFRFRSGMEAKAEYIVTDYWGKVVASGYTSPKTGVRLAPLPCGYYRLTLRDAKERKGDRSFAVLPENLHFKPNSPYAINSSQIWTSYDSTSDNRLPASGWRTITSIMRQGRISAAREFFGWKEIWPEKKSFRWEKYDRNIKMLRDAGIKVTGVYRDSVRWARYKDGRDDNSVAPAHIPDDLLLTYQFSSMLSSRYRESVDLWEFWNEPDGGFSGESAWDFASAMKAAYLGFKAGNPAVQVMIGSMCFYPPRPFVNTAMESDLVHYFDIFNYHTYNPIPDYPALMTEIQKLLSHYQAEDKPVYFTEFGFNSEGTASNTSYIRNLREHSSAQEAVIAELYPKASIILQSLGVGKVYPFVMTPFAEVGGTKCWGLVRHDYTIKPAFVTYVTLNRMLGDAFYKGEVVVPEGIRAYIFCRADGSEILVFWRITELEKGVSLADLKEPARKTTSFRIPLGTTGTFTLVDCLGRERTMTNNGTPLMLNAENNVQYLVLPGVSQLELKAKTPGPTSVKRPVIDNTVLLKAVLSDDFIISTGKNNVDFRKTSGKISLAMEIFNCSNKEKHGQLLTEGAKFSGKMNNIVISPMGKTVIPLEMEFPQEKSGKLVFGGKFNNLPISRLVIPYFKVDDAVFTQAQLRSELPDAWRTYSSGQMTISRGNTADEVRFDINFGSEKNRWSSPSFMLMLPQEKLDGAIGMEFEIKVNSEPEMVQYPFVYFYGKKKSWRELYRKPSGKWETRKLMFENLRDPSLVQSFNISLSSKGQKLSYSIKNIKFYYPGKEK